MKYRELLEGNSKESFIVCLTILQLDNEKYQAWIEGIMNKADEDIPRYILKKLKKISEINDVQMVRYRKVFPTKA